MDIRLHTKRIYSTHSIFSNERKEPLLSSSVSTLEYNDNGKWIPLPQYIENLDTEGNLITKYNYIQ